MKIHAALFALALAAPPCEVYAQTLDTPVDGADGRTVTDGAAGSPQTTIQLWPAPARALARLMISKYGTPSRFGEHALYWYDNGPWARTAVYRDSLTHSFLRRDKNFLQQSVGYQVPSDSVDDLKRFDERITIDADTGELSVLSESEALNFLTLNLAAEIITHVRSVDGARDYYRRARRLAGSGKSSSYLNGLVFEAQNDKGVNHWNP